MCKSSEYYFVLWISCLLSKRFWYVYAFMWSPDIFLDRLDKVYLMFWSYDGMCHFLSLLFFPAHHMTWFPPNSKLNLWRTTTHNQSIEMILPLDIYLEFRQRFSKGLRAQSPLIIMFYYLPVLIEYAHNKCMLLFTVTVIMQEPL